MMMNASLDFNEPPSEFVFQFVFVFEFVFTLCPPIPDIYVGIRDAIQKKYEIFWEFFPKGGGGPLNSQNFCKLTKLFLVCQNHS